MRATRTTALLSLTQFAEIIGIDPRPIGGFCACANDPSSGDCCDELNWVEYRPQSRRLTREDLLRQIAVAERDVARLTGVWIAPKAHTETLTYRRHNRVMRDDGNLRTLQTLYRNILAFGEPVRELLGTATVTITDETWEATLNLGVDPDSALYYEAFPPNGANGHDAFDFQIKPVGFNTTVDGSGDTILTASGNVWDIVDPAIYVTGQCCRQDCTLAEIQLYAVRITPCTEGTLYYPDSRCGGRRCADKSESVCWRATNAANGTVEPVLSDCDGNPCKVVPSEIARFEMRYISGMLLDDTGRVQHEFAEAVAWLALSRLGCEIPVCRCSSCVYEILKEARLYPRYTERLVTDSSGAQDIFYRNIFTATDLNRVRLRPITNGTLRAWSIIEDAEKQYRIGGDVI